MRNKLEVIKVNSIQEECSLWDSLVCVTDWSNREGYDIQLTSKNGGIQHLSITWSEFDLVKKIINKLEKL